MSRYENPDYQAFFKSFAPVWRQTATREWINYLNGADVHSNAKIRVNRTVVNFDKFHQAFDIGEKDGMYVPPAARVGIW